jgi:hypothetical protein
MTDPAKLDAWLHTLGIPTEAWQRTFLHAALTHGAPLVLAAPRYRPGTTLPLEPNQRAPSNPPTDA